MDGAVSAGPVAGGSHVYVALASGHLTARDAADGKEIWRQTRSVTARMAADGDLLFVASGDAIEAVRGDTGTIAWTVPRTTPVAPLIASSGWLIATTDTELIAIRAATGEVAWRQAAGGVKLAPVIDGDRVFTGAEDGRLLVINLKDGSVAWQAFFTGGIAAIAAHRGRVYVGAGDKMFYCLDAAKKADPKWQYRIGALAVGHVSVDDEHVYFAALDNVIRALDRQRGSLRWQHGMHERPSFGVHLAGHVVFVPNVSQDLAMVYDRGGISGVLNFPEDGQPGLPPSIAESPGGTVVYGVTAALTNEWHLTKYARAGEAALIPFAKLDKTPGLPYLTDPALQPIGNVLGTLLLGDPRLVPLDQFDWPIVLRDPPLVPLTTLPGVQLRPLSPVLPVRRAARGPGG